MACVVKWDAEDVAMWLEQCLQLPYRKTFLEAGIDGQKLIELTEEQLSDLGVSESSHLLRLLSHIAVFRSQLGRSLLVSEDAAEGNQIAPQSGTRMRQAMQGDAERSTPVRDEQKGRDQTLYDHQRKRSGTSLDRSNNGSAAKSGSRADQATTPRHQRSTATGRAKSSESTNNRGPVIRHSGSSPAASGGMRSARSGAQPTTPRGSGGTTPRGPGQRQVQRAKSAEGVGQQYTASSWRTPRKAATMPVNNDSQILVSTPASSSTWSPAGLQPSTTKRNGSAQDLGLWTPDEEASTKLDGSGFGSTSKVADVTMLQQGTEMGDLGGTSEFVRKGGDLGGTSEFVRHFAAENPEVLLSGRARSTPRLNSNGGEYSVGGDSFQPRSPRTDSFSGVSTSTKGGTGNSEFGKDRNRGATFYSTNRHLLNPVAKSTDGPEYYEKTARFYNGAMARKGAPQFGRDTRRTLECMFTKGQDGPGVGAYQPPPSKQIRGGSIGTSTRFRKSTATPTVEKTPGPYSYTPQHHYLSGFK